MQRGRNDYAHEDALLASIDAKLEKMRQRRIAAREKDTAKEGMDEKPAPGASDG